MRQQDSCEDCAHWYPKRIEGIVIYPAHCGLSSLACANDIAEEKHPPKRFLSRQTVIDYEEYWEEMRRK